MNRFLSGKTGFFSATIQREQCALSDIERYIKPHHVHIGSPFAHTLNRKSLTTVSVIGLEFFSSLESGFPRPPIYSGTGFAISVTWGSLSLF